MTAYEDIIGKTLTEIQADDVAIIFTADDGTQYIMDHRQDCCESVYVEDVNGDWADLIGSPITMATERVSNDRPELGDGESDEQWYNESFTYTFYYLATVKGSVCIRWFGSSNGYYSESVSFEKIYKD